MQILQKVKVNPFLTGSCKPISLQHKHNFQMRALTRKYNNQSENECESERESKKC